MKYIQNIYVEFDLLKNKDPNNITQKLIKRLKKKI